MSLEIAFLTAEAVPLAKVGGLADVAGALPPELERQGARVRIVMPGYRDIDRSRWGLRPTPLVGDPHVTVGKHREPWRLESARLPGSGVEILTIGGRYFDRPGLYLDPSTGREFEDQLERWVFFCRAALAALRARGQRLDVLHLNDHHTALAAAFVRHPDPDPFFASTATLFSIHNLGYQGLFPAARFPTLGLPAAFMEPLGPFEFWGRLNLMKAGLVLSDLLGTVSPTYAIEIQESEEHGYGLQGVLRSRRADLVGILNGIDDRAWDPAVDPQIAAHYGPETLAGKQECRRALRARFGMPDDARRPLFGMIGRLVTQKGIDVLLEALPELLPTGLQLVVLGSGQEEYERALLALARRWPDQVAVTLEFDDPLAHAIEAGCDFFLMPSRYEPCGLNQMYSLRYGTVPIVRRTGGLADTVREWDPERGEGNGFLFGPSTPQALAAAVHRALATFADPESMLRLRRNGMAEDFSWRRSAREYLEVYREACTRRRAHLAAAHGPAELGPIDSRPGIGTIREARERE